MRELRVYGEREQGFSVPYFYNIVINYIIYDRYLFLFSIQEVNDLIFDSFYCEMGDN